MCYAMPIRFDMPIAHFLALSYFSIYPNAGHIEKNRQRIPAKELWNKKAAAAEKKIIERDFPPT